MGPAGKICIYAYACLCLPYYTIWEDIMLTYYMGRYASMRMLAYAYYTMLYGKILCLLTIWEDIMLTYYMGRYAHMLMLTYAYYTVLYGKILCLLTIWEDMYICLCLLMLTILCYMGRYYADLQYM